VRAFVAVEVPGTPSEGARSSAPEHLTLLFLGEVPVERVEAIEAALAPVGADVRPFDLTLEGVGAFPSRERPRVVWVGATEGSEELGRLASRVRQALEGTAGPAPREERFVPHLTWFRVRSGADRRRAEEVLAGTVPPPPPRRLRVREFVLKESVLSSRGATHRTVASFPLRGSGSAGPG
jgi:RNA 2',3'-cyclic 3'-phosphodiesterase